ncbi:MAG: hypothetical protein HRT74_11820 [Flavobacteriales bacterium]|nr:hypothetical protein [Flavobacteriales bacterium]
MEQETALSYLGFERLPPLDVLEDEFEMAVFEQRRYFLSGPVIPKLFKSKAARLSKTSEAFYSLGVSPDNMSLVLPPSEFDDTDLVDLMKSWINYLSQTRLLIANSFDGQKVAEVANSIAIAKENMDQQFLEVTGSMSLPKVSSPKAADEIDYGTVLHRIQKGEDVEFSLARERARLQAFLT